MKKLAWLAAFATWCVLAASAQARVEFVLETGVGFDDATPVKPVGGNSGTTLGAQRRRLIERALEIWSQPLESKVPIKIFAEFDDLHCNENGGVVGGASPTGWISAKSNKPFAPPLIYPMALADRLAGRDVVPGRPDIYVVFNASLDRAPCREQLGGLYYGFDGAKSGAMDLLSTALHELAHGLGFSSTIDEITGEQQIELGVDVFSSQVLDLDLESTWDELTDAERARSTGNVRRLVFDGKHTQRAAPRELDTGVASVTFHPPVPGFSGYVADVGFALNPAKGPVRGPVVLADPLDGCSDFKTPLKGAIVVIEIDPDQCRGRDALVRAQTAGAAGVLLVVSSPVDRPALPLSSAPAPIPLPIVTLAPSDAFAVARALGRRPLEATLGGDPERRAGADELGRPLLFASSPGLRGSSISHFDPIARPDLLMEPYTSETPTHDLDVTVAVMRDLGWTTSCGNGKIDVHEECDEGAANDDSPGASCRSTCKKPSCGDRVRDEGEQCDQGGDNSDGRSNACRTDCTLPRCGDGVVDKDEQCDSKSDCSATCTRSGVDVPVAPPRTSM